MIMTPAMFGQNDLFRKKQFSYSKTQKITEEAYKSLKETDLFFLRHHHVFSCACILKETRTAFE